MGIKKSTKQCRERRERNGKKCMGRQVNSQNRSEGWEAREKEC